MNDTAILTSVKDYTLFSYGGKEIRFRAPRSLKRYLRINKWNAGYIAVETEYEDCTEEEYIDLVPILRDLCIEPSRFLAPIQKVEVRYESQSERSEGYLYMYDSPDCFCNRVRGPRRFDEVTRPRA